MSVLILTTGGTIDKLYFDALSEYQIGDSVVDRLLKTARVALPFRVQELLRKDSLELTDDDRAAVAQAVIVGDPPRGFQGQLVGRGRLGRPAGDQRLGRHPVERVVDLNSRRATPASTSAWRSPPRRSPRRGCGSR